VVKRKAFKGGKFRFKGPQERIFIWELGFPSIGVPNFIIGHSNPKGRVKFSHFYLLGKLLGKFPFLVLRQVGGSLILGIGSSLDFSGSKGYCRLVGKGVGPFLPPRPFH